MSLLEIEGHKKQRYKAEITFHFAESFTLFRSLIKLNYYDVFAVPVVILLSKQIFPYSVAILFNS
jgi:hypothetical protein